MSDGQGKICLYHADVQQCKYITLVCHSVFADFSACTKCCLLVISGALKKV